MSKLITIAVDAMGGDNSPEKVIKGLDHHTKLEDVIEFEDTDTINEMIN